MAVAADRPISQVLGDIAGNVQQLVRAELRLAKAELKEDVSVTKRAALLSGAGALSGSLALVCLCLALVFALALVMPAWAAALLVAIIVAAVAGLCFMAAKRQFAKLGMPRTIASVQESVQWVQTRVE